MDRQTESYLKVSTNVKQKVHSDESLGSLLNRLYATYDATFIRNDPLEIVRSFQPPRDREIVGLVAAALAYGRVETIRASVTAAVAAMGDEPWAFVQRFDPEKDSERFAGIRHRFNTGRDIACLLYLLQQVIRRYGSIESMFLDGYDDRDADIEKGLIRFVEGMLNLDFGPFYPGNKVPRNASVRFLLPSPLDGSACKRHNLYLRWMVRPDSDGLDLGVWTAVHPSKLVMPVDTHVSSVAQELGLTGRRQADWRMARELTNRLREFDPSDPVKYDFALCHWGMLRERTGYPQIRKGDTTDE